MFMPETVELIRRENRERLRVSESIMNLLLRLDSVRVLHYSALRDCRKSPSRKPLPFKNLLIKWVDVGPTDEDQHLADSEGMTEEALEKEREGEGGEVGCEEHEEEDDGDDGSAFEKNEMQTRLLSSLTQRVEQLERTYACDKLRKEE
ncbi:BAG domain [Sesbania bispinosa]|nr:BAG domain [Sesbania bispinosa]